MILNGCNILTTIFGGFSRHTNDIEWVISSLRTVKIQWIPERYACKQIEGMGLVCPSPSHLDLQISSSEYCRIIPLGHPFVYDRE